MKKLIALLAFFTLLGCNNKKEETAQTDSTVVAEKTFEEDSATLSTTGISQWVQEVLKEPDIPAEITLKEHWQEENLMVNSFTPAANFYTQYNSVLRWSPDSNFIIDIGSYGTVLSKDAQGKTTIEPGEPDTELALIEPLKKLRTRLMFVGPSAEILDAKWVNNSNAMVIGTFDQTGNNKYDTLVWVIDVKDKFFRLYNVKSHR